MEQNENRIFQSGLHRSLATLGRYTYRDNQLAKLVHYLQPGLVPEVDTRVGYQHCWDVLETRARDTAAVPIIYLDVSCRMPAVIARGDTRRNYPTYLTCLQTVKRSREKLTLPNPSAI